MKNSVADFVCASSALVVVSGFSTQHVDHPRLRYNNVIIRARAYVTVACNVKYKCTFIFLCQHIHVC